MSMVWLPKLTITLLIVKTSIAEKFWLLVFDYLSITNADPFLDIVKPVKAIFVSECVGFNIPLNAQYVILETKLSRLSTALV